MNGADQGVKLPRRRVLAVTAVAGGSVLGGLWFFGDPMGDVTPESPPYDLDEDGLFEDVNGDGRLDYRDVAMFSHDGVFEEITTEDLPSAFNYAYPDGGSDLTALTGYALEDEHDGLWTPDGNPMAGPR